MIFINVTDVVVKNDLCIGCGVCAGVCPTEALEIKFNKYGEYESYLIGNCLDSCSLCLEICPFNNKKEDEISEKKFKNNTKYYDENLGYYNKTYVGHTNNNFLRSQSASGGLTTWLLEQLLLKDKTDYIINVKSNNNPDKLFEFQIAKNVEEVRNGASSSYYPIEISKIIKEIKKNKGRYVIVGLPCFLKAIELAKEKDKDLKDRIIYTIGLTCGQLKNKKFTDYIAKKLDFNKKITNINYRNNSPDQPANNYYFHLENKDYSREVYFNEGINEEWNNRWFTYNSCNFCDDTFAEIADVTFMDAWLPEFTPDYKGNNLLIVRNHIINKLLSEGKKNSEIEIKKISHKKVNKSQQGVINIKRKKLSYRLFKAKKSNEIIPQKRVSINKHIDIFSKKEIKYKDEMQKLSKKLWFEYEKGEISFEDFRNSLNKNKNKLNRWLKLKEKLASVKNLIIK